MGGTNGDHSTVIGPDAHFKGELAFEKGASLLGSFEGQVVTKGDFVVAEGAKLQGEVQAGSIRLDGEVHGNLQASDKIHLSASAKLQGDLHTKRLEVVDGAVFVGRCVVGPNGSGGGDDKGAVKPAVPKLATEPAKAKPLEPVGAKK
ncbi:MAG: bactofilin family protein [Planctomycetota bacterium]|jgi:cytoskeletal protein CcmA (bactofilin family)